MTVSEIGEFQLVSSFNELKGEAKNRGVAYALKISNELMKHIV